MAIDDQNKPALFSRLSAPEMPSALSLIIVLAFIAIVFMMIFFPPKSADQAALAIINMLLGALVAKFGTVVDWWFGSNKSQQQTNETISALAQAPQPVAPTPAAPTVVVSWWSLFTAPEQAAIEAAAPGDPRVAAILTALKTGKAEAPDLTDLVSKGLLTQARADLLKAA